MSEGEKTAHHQAGARQEHDREGHFSDHQTGAESPVAKATASAFSAAGHGQLEIPSGGVDRRCKTANQRSQNGGRKCEKKDDPIQTDHRFLWNRTAWNDGYQAL